MRSSLLRGTLVAAALSAAIVWGCSNTTDDDFDNAGTDASFGGPPADVGVGNSDGHASATATARIANLTSSLGAIDFCYRAPGDDVFTGPVLSTGSSPTTDGGAGDADTSDGGSVGDADNDGGDLAGLAPFAVTNYRTLSGSGTFQIALVAPGSPSCAAPIATLAATLDAGKLTTIVITTSQADAGVDASASSAMPALTTFADDATVDATSARVRVINSSDRLGAVSVDVVASSTVTVSNVVDPGKAASASTSNPAVDALGYATISPLPPPAAFQIESADDTNAPPLLTVYADLGLDGASLHTAFLVDNAGADAVVYCSDKSTVGALTQCTLIGTQ